MMLDEAISEYLLWMISEGYAQSTWDHTELALRRFSGFIRKREIPWESIFTLATLHAFEEEYRSIWPVKGLWKYLFRKGRIKKYLHKQETPLPELYEAYCAYCTLIKNNSPQRIKQIRKILYAFNNYLTVRKISLSYLRIEHIDKFLAEYNSLVSIKTQQSRRSCLRGFLRYLFHERSVLHRDLAPLLKGPRLYSQATPPKFLRREEVEKIFASVTISSARQIRTYAMLHLAYTLGLRPKEISEIKLDDISFSQAELRIQDRKSGNTLMLPLPENTLKALAVYLIYARPKKDDRALFLSILAPHRRICPYVVSKDIRKIMQDAGVDASAYWLRHTYAQNLLEQGVSVFEIKQMLGHEKIKTSCHYLHIHIELMREVIFNETL